MVISSDFVYFNVIWRNCQIKAGVIVFYDQYVKLCFENNERPTALARKLGFSPNSPQRWKAGVVPKSDTVQKIADYFGVSTDYLLKGDGETFTNIANGTISGSSIVIGSKANEIISSAGGDNSLNLSEAEEELIRIFRKVGVRKQTQIMSFVFDLEEKE